MTPVKELALLRAVGERIRAHAFTLQYNRIDSSLTPAGKHYLSLRAKGKPKAFEAINQALQRELLAAEALHRLGLLREHHRVLREDLRGDGRDEGLHQPPGQRQLERHHREHARLGVRHGRERARRELCRTTPLDGGEAKERLPRRGRPGGAVRKDASPSGTS